MQGDQQISINKAFYKFEINGTNYNREIKFQRSFIPHPYFRPFYVLQDDISVQEELDHLLTRNLTSFKLQHCHCMRSSLSSKPSQIHPETGGKIKYSETTCGKDAYMRGANQTLLAYSLFGDMADSKKGSRYFSGIASNLELLPRLYPGLLMRLYTDIDRSGELFQRVCGLACSSPLLDICHVSHLPGTPMKYGRPITSMAWRFLPAMDPQVSNQILPIVSISIK